MAKWIMGIVAVTFISFMIFEEGMGASGGGSGATAAIASVNGQTITVTEFQTAVRNEQERLRQQQGSIPITLEGQQALDDQVLEQMIQNILLRQEYERRGIRVTDQEIVDAARSSPPPEVFDAPQFQTDGQFDPEKYRRFIASGADPQFLMALEARYREEIPRFKLFRQLTAGIWPSDAQLWRAYKDQQDSLVATLLEVAPARVVPDTAVALSEEEVAQYYREHREDFSRPATAYLSYVTVSRRATPEDSVAARRLVDSLRQAIVEGVEDFETVARRESMDSASAREGGDLGEVPWGQFVAPFEDAVRALAPGIVSEPVTTQFGWHLIRVEEKTDSTFHAQHILIRPAPMGARLERVEATADTLDLFGAEQDDPAALDEVARDLGLTVFQAQPLFEGFRLPVGDDVVGDASVWAFGAGEVGITSPVIETPAAYYLFRLDSLQEAGIPPLERVRDQARSAARAARRLEMARAIAREIGQAVATGTRLEEIAARRDLQVVGVGPFTRVNPPPQLRGAPEVVGVAFGLGIGQTGGPVHTAAASYFVRPERKVLADSTAWRAQLEQQRAQVLQQLQSDRIQLILSSLRRNADVEDFRAELERARQEAERQSLPQSPLGF